MVKAKYNDKPIVVGILTNSFDTNESVNYLIQQDHLRKQRIMALMEYSFDVSYLFGDVYLSEDKCGCALVLYPDKKRTILKSIVLDFKLAISCIGLTRIGKVLSREAKVKAMHPKEPFYYLWFIGVDPAHQNKGIGTKLLRELMEDSHLKDRKLYLETSCIKNIPWYKKMGLKVYSQVDLTYPLYFIKSGE